MRTWTVDEMLNEWPCRAYNRARITELWAGRERLSLAEICDLPIPPKDIIWVGCIDPPSGWIDATVTRAVTNHALHCGIPSVEIWARHWLDGSNRTAEAAREAAAAAAATAAWEVTAAAAAAAAVAEVANQLSDLRFALKKVGE